MDQNIHFFLIGSSQDAAMVLADKITKRLELGPVLWLVSGGSAIKVAVDCAKRLSGKNLSGLTISLADERYGPQGHAESNWLQLLDGSFDVRGATARPFLTDKTFDDTLRDINDFFASVIKPSVYKIALLGIGADGHIAGILPGSPAISSQAMVVGYQDNDHKRITLSLTGLKKLDEAFLYAVGETKASQLGQLSHRSVDPSVQPAQIIKTLPVWSVYNDRIGREI